jgi:TadE-like protein
VRRLARRCRQRGAVAVEFALVLPLFLLLILGGIDWGYFFFASQVTANAAREGARTASLVIGAPCTTGEAMAINYLRRGQLISSDTDPRLLPFNCGTPGQSCCQQVDDTLPSGGGIVPIVRVTVRYQARPGSMSLTGFLWPALLPTTVTAVATMRYEP